MERHGRHHAIAVVALAGLLLGACAGAVKESERDTSGRFDGRWSATVEEGLPSNVSSGQWKKTCSSGDWRFTFDVEDGTVTFPLGDVAREDWSSAFVNGDGEFRLVVPRGQRNVSSRESGSVGTSTLRWIFDGTLEEGESNVKFTVGDSKYGGAGCWWRLDVERG